MKTTAVTLACFVVALALPIRSNERLTMKLTPPVAVAPAALTVRTTVEADQANRILRVEIDSGTYFRSSEITLDGERSNRNEQWVFRGLPAGRYVITATLIGSNGQRASTSQWFQASHSVGQ